MSAYLVRPLEYTPQLTLRIVTKMRVRTLVTVILSWSRQIKIFARDIKHLA